MRRRSTVTVLTLIVLVLGFAAGACSGGGGTGSFCNTAKTLDKKYGPNFDPSKDPSLTKQAVADLRTLIAKAPSEIRDDLKIEATAMEELGANDLASINRDSAKIQAASKRIATFFGDKCGIKRSQ